jgi:protein-tyrosine phosphatase
MVAEPFWITPNLAIVSRPRGGDWLDDEMIALREAGVDILVSTLKGYEASELGLEEEELAAKNASLRFVSFPIADRGTPEEIDRFQDFLEGLEQEMADGKKVGVHCRACIGRSSVVAASLLIRSGVAARQAWHQIEAARKAPVPDTAEQLEWVNRHMRPSAQ